ncbi:MAG: hypothetical protein V4721_10445 [Bacteroidota bacterium]
MPNNHSLYSHFAPECVASKEDLKEHFFDLIGLSRKQSLMWRSKPLSAGIWLSKWNKVYWFPHLLTRTLKPSIGKSFEEKFSESLEVIPVSHFQLLENKAAQTTLDISGHTSKKEYEQLDLFSASLKTSETTSISGTSKLKQTWKDLVTQLGKESIQRKKQARLTREIGCLSSQFWTTPTVHQQLVKYQQGGTPLACQVQICGTPRNPTNAGHGYAKNSDKGRLEDQVMNWPTPTTRDYKDGTAESCKNVPENALLGRVVHQRNGQQDQAKISTNGNTHVLNPNWVFQLMGTTLEKTFCDYREMESWKMQQR